MTTNDKDKKSINNKEKLQAREVTADSRNTSLNRGRTRVRNTLDLDFDFDFKKRTVTVATDTSPDPVNDGGFVEPSFEEVVASASAIPKELPEDKAAAKAPEADAVPESHAVTESSDGAEVPEKMPESVPAGEQGADETPAEVLAEESAPAGDASDADAAVSDAVSEVNDPSDDTALDDEAADTEAFAEEDASSESSPEEGDSGKAPEQADADQEQSDHEQSDQEDPGYETVDYFYEEDIEDEYIEKPKRFGLFPDLLRIPDESELEDDDDLDYLLEPKHPFSIKKKRHPIRAARRAGAAAAVVDTGEGTSAGEEAGSDGIEAAQALRIVTGKAPLMKDNKSKAVARSKAKSGSAAASATKSKSGTKTKSTSQSGSSKPKKSTGTSSSGGNGGNGGNGSGGGSSPKKKKKKIKKKRNKVWIFFRALIITLISFGILGCIAGGAYTAYVISNAETIHPDQIYDTLAVSTYIYDDKEKLVDEIYFNENRQIITYDQLPENLKNAFIAVEDKTFWTHKGFNFRRIVGAILEKFNGGGRISGTSTITQQLARNVFLPEDKSVRSIKRKIIEMYYAYEIEEELSKEEILTAYLNTIYLGYGCYGVDTAARKYFSRSVEKLTLSQCAALAALPQAPGSYALIVNEKGENTTKIRKGVYANDTSESRRNLVLQLMYEQGYITEKQRDKATKPLKDFIKPGSTSTASSTSAFKDYLIETVKNDLMEQYDLSEEQAVKLIYTKGLRIYSTMDSQAQKVITKEFKESDNFPSANKKGVKPEAAMVISEVGTGKIKAMVGSRNADGQMLFNRATNPRQPGSSIKPLTVYSAALQKSYEYQKKGQRFQFVDTGYDKQGPYGWGDYITVSSPVIDEKMTVKGETWPLNVTRTYSGANTFRSAIQKSINTCAVKILAQVGIPYSMDMLLKFGITSAIDDTSEPVNDVNLAALALGAMSEGISPLEMSLAYATFPNGGVRNTGICYTRVEDNNGRTILEAKSKKERVLDKGVAWIMTNVLQSVVTNGLGRPAALSDVKVGGKTGTTDSRYDIWFSGFTPSYSAALWIGTDENVQMDSYSEKAAALWGEIMGQVKRCKNGTYPGMPNNVFRAWNGEYYTNGTAPPEPEPEEEEEEEEGEEGKDGKEKGDSKDKGSGKKDSGKSKSKDD